MDNRKPITELLQNLFSEVSEFYAESKRIERARWEKGDSFNIFNTLGLWSEEVRLHSAFIGELLNPKGSHGTSALFLETFLEIIGIEKGYIDCEMCSSDILERIIGPVTENDGGRIDIIIEDGRHAVIIENKIYASDQRNQLLRYHNYGEKMFQNGYELLYLTLDGYSPSKFSVGNQEFHYRTIAYETEILEWLDKCSKLIPDQLPVRAVIRQYIDLVKQLTNKDMDVKYREQLKSLALSKENVLAVGELFKIYDEWFDCLLEEYIWQPLEAYAQSKNLKFGHDDSGGYIHKAEWNYYAIFVETDRSKDWNKMYVGIREYDDPNAKNKIYKKDYCPLNCLKQAPDKRWPYPYGWEYLPDAICDWSCHITEEIVNGTVFNWVKTKIDEVLKELDERNLPMP